MGPTWVGLYQAGQASLLNSPKIEKRERGERDKVITVLCSLIVVHCAVIGTVLVKLKVVSTLL